MIILLPLPLAFSFSVLIWLIRRSIRKKMLEKAFNDRLKEKKEKVYFKYQECKELFNKLPSLNLDNQPISELTQKIKDGIYKSEDVLSTYVKKCYQFSWPLNHLSENIFLEALNSARSIQIDRGSKNKSLLGIPISIKDTIDLKGCDTTDGLVRYSLQPKNEDSDIVKLIKNEGGIPFVKTNIPQASFVPESLNLIYGRGINPWNIERTIGGSSGGCSGITSVGASPLSIGVDLGGSIRTPSNFCGVYGIKPSCSRIPNFNPHSKDISYIRGLQELSPAIGPITCSVSNIHTFFRGIFNSFGFSLDPYIIPLEFREDVYTNFLLKKGLRIGYFTSDGIFPACLSSCKAVEKTVELLTNEGYHCIPFKMQNLNEGFLCFMALSFAEGNMHTLRDELEDEKFLDLYKEMILFSSIPNFLLKIAGFIFRKMGQRRMSAFCNSMQALDSEEYATIVIKSQKFKEDFNNYWDSLNLDGLICPVNSLPALKHNYSSLISCCTSYSALFNLLGMPAGALPIRLLNSDETFYEDQEKFNDKYIKIADEVMKDSEGLPIGIQVITKSYHEEECIGLMKIIENIVKFNEKPDLSKCNLGSIEKINKL